VHPAAPLVIPGLRPVAPYRCPNGPLARPRCTGGRLEILWRWPAPERHPDCYRRPPVGKIKEWKRHSIASLEKCIFFQWSAI